jgi:hypothetical protein
MPKSAKRVRRNLVSTDFEIRKDTMKSTVALLFLGTTLYAGFTQEYQITEKGLHHRVWERSVPYRDAQGRQRVQTSQIVELQGGLHRWTEQGWVTTDPKVELFQDNAVVRNLQYGAIFAANLATPGAIDLSLPDGQRLTGHLLGLAYTEAGNSVLIAEVKDCVGVVGGAAQNEVTYLDAFTDFKIAVQYVTQRDRISQNIIVEQQLPSPVAFGLTENAVLEVLTEFIAFPELRKERRDPIEGINAEHLSFASTEFLTGRAFSLGQENNAVSVGKAWEAFENNRWFLVEKVPWRSIAAELAKLPPVAKDWRKKEGGVMARKDMHLPDRRQARAAIKPIRMASAPNPPRGYVIDWELVSSVNSNLWQADKTYYISGSVSIKTNIFEGGCVIKYAPTNSAKLTVTGPATFLSTNYAPVVMTARDDHTVGEQIGSVALSGYSATKAVEFDSNASGTTYDIHDLRISHATTALSFFSGRVHTVRNLQIVHCLNGVSGYSASFNIFNGLLHQVDISFNGNGSSTTGKVQHLTFNQSSNLNSGTMSLFVTNSLLVAVTNITSFTGAYNGTNSDPGSVFQAVGAGSNYLASGSAFRDSGTTNIDPSLLNDLRRKTTYPPQILSNVVALDTTLRPYAQRDTDMPDLGYHYDSIDYAVNTLRVTNGATLTLANGVALATFGDSGVWLQDYSALSSQGKPDRHNQITWFHCVQEQSTNWGNGAVSSNVGVSPANSGISPPIAQFRFTDFTKLASGGDHMYSADEAGRFASLVVRDCEFNSGATVFSGTNTSKIGTTNNLFYRVGTSFLYDGQQSAFNNLFKGGTFYVTKVLGATNDWIFKDNSFDSVTIVTDCDVTNSHNAYINCNARLTPNASTDVVTNSFTYHLGPLGRWYQPTNSALVDKGSLTNAALAGLYHYTTATNALKEANTTVDIGLHYVAADYATGVPLDYDGDTWADWFEDINGNGTYDSAIGESDWQTYNSIYGIGSGPGLQVFTPLK